MSLTTRRVASMYAQIVNGLDKEKSQHVTDEESSKMWDTIASEVAEMREANPDVVFSIPNEMPDADDEPEGEPEAEPEEPGPDDEPEAEEPEPEEPEPEATEPGATGETGEDEPPAKPWEK